MGKEYEKSIIWFGEKDKRRKTIVRKIPNKSANSNVKWKIVSGPVTLSPNKKVIGKY